MSHFKSGQTLTAGQVNTIAHQGIQLIEEQVLETAAGTVSFNSIPQNFQSLWLVMSGGVDSTAARVAVVQFNGDGGGTSYASHRFNHVGDGTSANSYDASRASIELGIINTNLLAQNSIYIPGYARTDRQKSTLSNFTAPSTDAPSSLLGFCGGQWKSTSAITDMLIGETLLDGSRAIIAGSIFTLYGLGDTTA